MGLGNFLRGARERRGLTIHELALRAKIKPELLVDLENDDVRRWPKARVYRHGYLRACADALGLDPAAVLDRFDAEFGDPYPPAFHRRRRPAARPVRFPVLGQVIVLGMSMLILAGAVATIFNDAPSRIEEIPSIPSQQFDMLESPWVPAIDSTFDLAPSDAEGELRIISNPPRAHVTVNGIGRGATPVRVRYLPPGRYTIRVIHPERPIIERRVMLSPERPRRTVRVALPDSSTTPAF